MKLFGEVDGFQLIGYAEKQRLTIEGARGIILSK